MLHVISNPDYVALDLSVAADSKSASRSKIKLRQSVIDTVAALSGMAIVIATWYGLHMFLALSAMKDLPSFIVD